MPTILVNRMGQKYFLTKSGNRHYCCRVDGCIKRSSSERMCISHFKSFHKITWKANRNLIYTARSGRRFIYSVYGVRIYLCLMEDCNKDSRTQGYCREHNPFTKNKQ